ncbi:unnamed protein product [Boreogadus saida]
MMGKQKAVLEMLAQILHIRHLLLQQGLAECLGTLVLVSLCTASDYVRRRCGVGAGFWVYLRFHIGSGFRNDTFAGTTAERRIHLSVRATAPLFERVVSVRSVQLVEVHEVRRSVVLRLRLSVWWLCAMF